MTIESLKSAIRDVPDFPTEGIIFKDITPILADPALFRVAVDLFVERHRDRNIDSIAVIESRGFIFGSTVAYRLGAGLIPVRKKGKLPEMRDQHPEDGGYRLREVGDKWQAGDVHRGLLPEGGGLYRESNRGRGDPG